MTYPEHYGQLSPEILMAEALHQFVPELPMPNDKHWPLYMHKSEMREQAAEELSDLVERLAEPVQGVTPELVRQIIGRHDLDPEEWLQVNQDGSFGVSGGFSEPGDTRHVFDRHGRLRRFEKWVVPSEGRHVRFGQVSAESFTYDAAGYITSHWVDDFTGWYIDNFDYAADYSTGAARQVPIRMTRTWLDSGYPGQKKPIAPMAVDLADWQGWLDDNRTGGYEHLARNRIRPAERIFQTYEVREDRSGIRFGSVAELEDALVNYGGALRAFVRERITQSLEKTWSEVRLSGDPKLSRMAFHHFGAGDGTGLFASQDIRIEISKSGIELFMERDEPALAACLGKKQGLRGIFIYAPVNQSGQEGSFFVDVVAACQQLDIDISSKELEDYIGKNFGNKTLGALWLHEDASGVDLSAHLIMTTRDSRDVDLMHFISNDSQAVWGPLPKRTFETDAAAEPLLCIRILPRNREPFVRGSWLSKAVVVPAHSAYNASHVARTEQIARGFVDKIQAAIAGNPTEPADSH